MRFVTIWYASDDAKYLSYRLFSSIIGIIDISYNKMVQFDTEHFKEFGGEAARAWTYIKFHTFQSF